MTWQSAHNRSAETPTERKHQGDVRRARPPRVGRGWRVSGAAVTRLIPFALERSAAEPDEVRRRDGRYRLLLALADVFAAAAALAACIPLAGNGDQLSFAAVLGIPLIAV